MKLWAIAYNTFRENIRDRVQYNLLVFAVLLIGVSLFLGELTIGERERLTIDVSLTAISVFGVLMAVFLGVGLVSKEIEKKTIYTLIAKPLPRYLFILGRFLGLMITIGVNLLVMTVAAGTVLGFTQGASQWPLTWPMVQAIILIYVELGIITAAAMAFSTFSSPTLSAIFSLSFFVIGRLTPGLRELGEKAKNPVLYWSAKLIYSAVPNLRNYVMIEQALYGDGLPAALFLELILIGLLTTALALIVSMTIFQRRDFV